jgi:hypothetical protein
MYTNILDFGAVPTDAISAQDELRRFSRFPQTFKERRNQMAFPTTLKEWKR